MEVISVSKEAVWEAMCRSRPQLRESGIKPGDEDFLKKLEELNLDGEFAKINRHLKEQKGISEPTGGSTIDSSRETCPYAECPDAPAYEPERWNDEDVIGDTNCYAYAMNSPTGHDNGVPNPGDFSGKPSDTWSCEKYTAAVLSDGEGGKILKAEQCPYQFENKLPPPQKPGYYLVALVMTKPSSQLPKPVKGGAMLKGYINTMDVNDGYKQISREPAGEKFFDDVVLEEWAVDYHWYRQDPDGTWSHKPGSDTVTKLDASNNPITNPQTCDRNGLGGEVMSIGDDEWTDPEEEENDQKGIRKMKRYDPATISHVNYEHFCGYFYVQKGGVPVRKL